ncbi:MAG: AMP-binding protein, partial [Planctomycetota bacterium]
SFSDSEKDPALWSDQANRHGVTIWNSVPALMQLFVDEVQKQDQRTIDDRLRHVMMSGDWIPVSLPEEVKSIWPAANVTSLGGATEVSIWSIFHNTADIDSTWPSVPYGRPLTNQSWHVFDENLNPRPPMVPGQLYIGGEGLAHGYWNDQELTAEKFVPNSMSQKHSGRLYKTGDWGRLRQHCSKTSEDAEWSIEFLGREDQQVKVNGYRIEAGEIEAVLNSHPAIEHAVVSAVGSPPELIGYVVPKRGNLNDRGNPLTSLTRKAELVGLVQQESDDSVVLLSPAERSAGFRRQSHRQFIDDELQSNSLAKLLSVLQAEPHSESSLPKYRYPSAGSLYPVYLVLNLKANRVAGINGGWYRYDAKRHGLVPVIAASDCKATDFHGVNKTVFEQCSFAAYLIADMRAIEPVYGARARDFCLLEAGYIGQLLMEAAPDHDIGICPVNDPDMELLPSRLQLGPEQVCLHGFLGGPIAPDWSERWVAVDQPISRSLQDQIRDFLHTELPAYMVPRRYLFLTELPLSSNGKVDRKALPVPTSDSLDYEAPTNGIERAITEIWQEQLKVDQVGINDDFFQLGGSSLQALQLMSSLREQFDVELTINALLGALTPKAQAELIQSRQESGETRKTIQRIARNNSVDQLSDDEVNEQLKQLLSD